MDRHRPKTSLETAINISALNSEQLLTFCDGDGGYWLITPVIASGRILKLERRSQRDHASIATFVLDGGTGLVISNVEALKRNPHTTRALLGASAGGGLELPVRRAASDSEDDDLEELDTAMCDEDDDGVSRFDEDDDSHSTRFSAEAKISEDERETTASTPQSCAQETNEGLATPAVAYGAKSIYPRARAFKSPNLERPPLRPALKTSARASAALVSQARADAAVFKRSQPPRTVAMPKKKVRQEEAAAALPRSGRGKGRGKDTSRTLWEKVDGFDIPLHLLEPLQKAWDALSNAKRYRYPRLRCPITRTPGAVTGTIKNAQWYLWCSDCGTKHECRVFLDASTVDALGVLWLAVKRRKLPYMFPREEYTAWLHTHTTYS